MHERSIAHRDVKPENILLVCEKYGGVAKIADFGSNKKVLSDERQTIVVGTPYYYAPERATSTYDEKVDVWSLGVVLYEMLTGGDHPVEFDFNP